MMLAQVEYAPMKALLEHEYKNLKSNIYIIIFILFMFFLPIQSYAQVMKIDEEISGNNITNKYILDFYNRYSHPLIFRKKIGNMTIYYMQNDQICSDVGCINFIIKGSANEKPDLVIQSLNHISISDSQYSMFGSGVTISFFRKDGSKIQINLTENFDIIK